MMRVQHHFSPVDVCHDDAILKLFQSLSGSGAFARSLAGVVSCFAGASSLSHACVVC